MPARQCTNWLHTLSEYAENTESPRSFWAWAGIFVLSSALERRVWLPYGIADIYPNLFLMTIAPPGRCRKSVPISFAKKILQDVQCNVFVDSPTKRALTKQLSEYSRMCAFQTKSESGVQVAQTQCPCVLVSKELSSFFAVDLKGMVEILTDLWDSHDVWEYKTSDKGEDKLYNLCVGCYFASTPDWIARNLPQEAIGGGFTSRFVILYANEKYKLVAIPPELDKKVYKSLVEDLAQVKRLSGRFVWEEGAKEFFTSWYGSLEEKVKKNFDSRLNVYYEREHIIALKVAMALRVSYSDELLLTKQDLGAAIAMVEEIEQGIPKAFGSHGESEVGVSMDTIINQLRVVGELSIPELLRFNYHDIRSRDLVEIVETLKQMGLIETRTESRKGKMIDIVKWIGKKGAF